MMLYWGAAAAFAVSMLIALLLKPLFHLEGPAWYLVLGVMGALGVGSASIWMYFQAKRQARKDAQAGGGGGGGAPAAAGGPAGGTEADQWIREANARLAHSKGAGIANLPLIFVAGDRGAAKTSTILNSGLEPELLAGQIYQDNVVAPTRGANIFFARDTVVVEAGGTLMAQPSNWKALVAKLEPGKLRGTNSLAPRGVMLCFDLEAFSRQGAADSVANAARYLQERLGEVSQVLGISYPVYVLFTRADRVPFFADFVRNLTNDEAGQVVGATLPIRTSAGGIYAEEETRRISDAFNQLVHSFCDQRLRLLPRETDAEKIPGAYEFPREFRKLRNLLTQFLVDVGRPSQLRASPFLRGFYFSGVRPVEVRDIPAPLLAPTPAPAAAAHEVSGATSMFRAGMLAERKAQQAMAPQAGQDGGTRRVPQWLFLGHLFHEVVLADSAARATSGASIKTSLTKRILLGTAAGLCLFYSIMLLVSFFGNQTLENNAITAARNIAAGEASGANLPSEDALRRLETLRQSLAQLTDYQSNGAPFGLRWGLYSGSSMLPQVRRIYYNKFRQLLFGSTQTRVLTFLQKTPVSPGPNDDYGYAYDSLKAYLLTTAEWKRSADPNLQSFLGSRLLARWTEGRDADIGKARTDLAKLQFDFYAKDLPNGNPFTPSSEGSTVDHARVYLSGFSGVERVYRFLVGEASKLHPPANFNQQFPGTAEAVTNTVDVAWAYTRDGWKYMQDQIKKQNFGGEQWVLGAYQGQTVDQATMESGILSRYTSDYIALWRKVMQNGRVNPYASLQDASKKLNVLTSSGAPLLALFWWVSQNTAVDLPGVSDKFRSVQAVVPPSQVQQYIVPQNQIYNAGLMTLQQAVDRAANKEPNADQAERDSAQSATQTTRQLTSALPPDPDAHLEKRSEELLLQPIKYLDGMGAQDLRAGGARVCAAFNALTTKFPFNPLATPEVSMDELGDILRPKTGKLWVFYDTTLKDAMTCQNGDCVAKGNPPLNPAFVSSISQLMKFSRALYGDAGVDPNLTYKMKPLPTDQISEFTITINGQAPVKLKGGEDHSFVFPGPGTPGFKMGTKQADGGTPEIEEPASKWAVFRFFFGADTVEPAPGGYTLTWRVVQGTNRIPQLVKGKPLVYQFFVDTVVFSKDFLSRLKCNVPVTR
jgi:type VI secretion system protein ImpL